MIKETKWSLGQSEPLSNLSEIPLGKNFFQEEELQKLWDVGAQKDTNFYKLYLSLWRNKRSFPTELGVKTSLSECDIDNRGALYFTRRLWIPEWELLKTALIQNSYDSRETGHPGHNSTLAIVSTNFN